MGGLAETGVADVSRDSEETRTRQVGNNGKSKTTVRATRVMKAADLLERVASGSTIVDAAKAIGVSRKTGQELYHEALAEITRANTELRQHLIARDLETLRLLLNTHMPIALRGDTASAKIVLGILDRHAKLLGLDAAIKVEVSNARVDEVVGQIVELLEESAEEPPLLGPSTQGAE